MCIDIFGVCTKLHHKMYDVHFKSAICKLDLQISVALTSVVYMVKLCT